MRQVKNWGKRFTHDKVSDDDIPITWDEIFDTSNMSDDDREVFASLSRMLNDRLSLIYRR